MLTYFLGMALLAAATHGAHRIAGAGRGNIAPGAAQAFVLVGAASFLAYLAMFIAGFFQISWWAPLAAIPVSWICGGIVSALLPSLLAPVNLAAGITLALWSFR
jgi:hypothetical protein